MESKETDIQQYPIRIDFSSITWEIDYLRASRNTGQGTTIIKNSEGGIQLLPYYQQQQSLSGFLSETDLVAEYLALGLEQSLLLQQISLFLENPEDREILVSSNFANLEVLKKALFESLSEMKKSIKNAMVRLPSNIISIIAMESIAPVTPMPFPAASLPLFIPLATLTKKYYILLKELNRLIKEMSDLDLNLVVEDQLDSVEGALEHNDFTGALSITDDLDGIIGNDQFTEQTLTLAEYIIIKERLSIYPESFRDRLKKLLKTDFWKNLSPKNNTSFMDFAIA